MIYVNIFIFAIILHKKLDEILKMSLVQAKDNYLISKKIKLSNTFLKKIFLRDKVYERVKNTLLCTLKS